MRDTVIFTDGTCIITLFGLSDGLNGKNGLIREHWAQRKKRLDSYILRLKSLRIKPFNGEVALVYRRYTSRFMDWDNAAASFKIIGDALVKSGILKDDSPKIITEFKPEQIKSSQIEQKTEIIIGSL